MDALLDRFYEEIEQTVKSNFKEYYVTVFQMNYSFFVLVNVVEAKFLGRKESFYLTN